MNLAPHRRRTRWLWIFNVLLALVAGGLWQKLRWRKTSDTPAGLVWQRSLTTHRDSNRDGLVDEESIRLPNGDQVIRRDANNDGWFDFRYTERQGTASQLQPIHEPVPRH